MKKLVLIKYQFSVVVKSLEKGLKELNYSVTVMDDDIETLKMMLDGVDVILIYLQDSILDNSKQVENLFLLCDTLKDKNRRMIMIGSDRDKYSFLKAVPVLKDYMWMSRPVDMNELKGVIDSEIERIEHILAPKRLLIIDDDPSYALMAREWLREFFKVDVVNDGIAGISFLANHEVDLILLDYEMPVVNGPKILEMLRSHYDTANIPVMFLTGVGTKESIKRVMSLKPQGYILKTTTREDLIKTVKGYFDRLYL